MSLTKEVYISRLIDKEIEENLKLFGAISIEGPKFMCIICGLYDAVIKRPDGIYVLPITVLKP